jgi:hypothetical protein
MQAVSVRVTVSLLIFMLAVPKLGGQAPPLAVRVHTAADSLEVVRPLVSWLLRDRYSSLRPGARIFAGDRLTFAALDSVSQAQGFLLEPPIQPGTRIGCPYKMVSDSAGVNEKAAQKGLLVGFEIFALSDSTAIAGFGVRCGLGVAPLSAYATATKFRLKRVNRRSGFRLQQVKHEWVIESVIDSWVT